MPNLGGYYTPGLHTACILVALQMKAKQLDDEIETPLIMVRWGRYRYELTCGQSHDYEGSASTN